MCWRFELNKGFIIIISMCPPSVFHQIHKEVGHRRPAYWCVKNWGDAVSSQLYEVYMLWVMLILPLAVMSFAYVSICKELWIMTSLRSTMATRG